MILDFLLDSLYDSYVFRGVLTMQISIRTIICPDPKCHVGKIIVHNAYDPNPLVGKEQPCDRCNGKGFLVLHAEAPLDN